MNSPNFILNLQPQLKSFFKEAPLEVYMTGFLLSMGIFLKLDENLIFASSLSLTAYLNAVRKSLAVLPFIDFSYFLCKTLERIK